MREKVPIPLDGIRICTFGIRAHRASDDTTRAGTPRVSRNKHFGHSPTSSIMKHNHAKKHSNSYLRDRDVRHLQGPPLSRTKRVRERRKTELTAWEKKMPIPLDGMCVCCMLVWKGGGGDWHVVWSARTAAMTILQLISPAPVPSVDIINTWHAVLF